MIMYEKPEIEILNIDASSMVAVSMRYTTREADADSEVLVNSCRGGWGDIWEK